MIAISYRREDSTPVAGRLHDRLRAEFGKENVFMDFDSIPYGVDFREHIKSTLERADVVIAVVGPGWLGSQKEASRRIDDPNDFVRLEIAGALQRGIPVIPILVDNTTMPKPDSLPPDMQAFAFRNALTLNTGIDFHHHADRLVGGIRRLLENAPPKPMIASDEPKPTRAVDEAEAASPDTESKDQQAPEVSAPANIELHARPEEPLPEEEVLEPKPTSPLNEPLLAPSMLEHAPPSPPPELAAKEPRKFNWNQKQIAIAGGGLVLFAISFGIVMFERNRSNTGTRSISPVPDHSPVASTTRVETAVPTIVPTTSPFPSPESTVAQSTETPMAEATAMIQKAAPSTSPTNQFAQNGRTWQAWIGDFIREFVAANQSPDSNAVLPFYSSTVSYFDEPNRDQEYIHHDIEKYNQRWPIRHDEIEGDIHIQEKVPGWEYAANFKLNFYAESAPRQIWTKGQFAIDLDITIDGGTPKISGIQEKTLHQQKGKPGTGANQNARRKSYPLGIAVRGKAGFVRSPYAPSKGDIDVRRFSKGTEVKCPFTGKIFVVP